MHGQGLFRSRWFRGWLSLDMVLPATTLSLLIWGAWGERLGGEASWGSSEDWGFTLPLAKLTCVISLTVTVQRCKVDVRTQIYIHV